MKLPEAVLDPLGGTLGDPGPMAPAPFLGDRLALSLINRRQVQGSGFAQTESGAVSMDESTRKAVLTAYHQRKQEELQHPFLQEKIAVGLLPHAQAMLMARHLRGDLDGYPPFVWK